MICHLCGGGGTCLFCDGTGKVDELPLIHREDFHRRSWAFLRDAHTEMVYQLAMGTVPYEVMMRARAYILAGLSLTHTGSGYADTEE